MDIQKLGKKIRDTNANKTLLPLLGELDPEHPAAVLIRELMEVRGMRKAAETYGDTWVDQHVEEDGYVYPSWRVVGAETGRMACADPNMQNMPRGGTFPVKKVFVSRWEGGKIMEADFAQLEFRAAAYLSQDEVAINEVSTGFDVHAYTAQVITDAGQPTDRQTAKAHTFAPLYGATGFGRTRLGTC